jgi:1,2-diacylglycerol-3-alpha-glucose alpha-1,2-glucosyltransferase
MSMRISHYLELEGVVDGGIRESVRHQRQMLSELDIEYTTDPSLEVDLIHLNLVGPRSLYYATRARRRGVPVVAHTHITSEDFGGSFRFTNALSKPLRPYLERAYGLADMLVCPSEYNRDIIREYADVETTVLTNGVDARKLEGYESLRAEYLDRYDLSPPVVFMVGHVIKRKGLETFVETARKMPEFDFAWFGPVKRPLKGRPTKRLIDSAPDNCTFPGFVEDVRGAYAAVDIFFFPTYEENEGIALLEAMVTETPVVVRDIETFDWLEDGTNCLKVENGFRDALERLTDPELRERLGANAATRSEAFRLSNVADELEACYTEVLR